MRPSASLRATLALAGTLRGTLRGTLAGVTAAQHGQFLNHDGSPIPW